jgi:hypothetical protein
VGSSPCGRISVGLAGSEAGRAAVRALFRSVAAEKGWAPGGDLLEAGGESTIVAAFFDGHLAGGAEVRKPDHWGWLPLEATWPELSELACPSPAELVLIALAPEFRAAPELLWALCAETWRACARSGIADLFAAVPPRNLPIYRRLGWCPETVGPERSHWGEPCVPCRIGIEAAREEFERRAERSSGHAIAVRIALRD